jgi:hypothetical protein
MFGNETILQTSVQAGEHVMIRALQPHATFAQADPLNHSLECYAPLKSACRVLQRLLCHQLPSSTYAQHAAHGTHAIYVCDNAGKRLGQARNWRRLLLLLLINSWLLLIEVLLLLSARCVLLIIALLPLLLLVVTCGSSSG